MGCIASKQAVSVTPAFDYSGASRDDSSTAGASGGSSGILSKSLRRHRSDKKKNSDGGASAAAVASQLGDSGRASSNADSSSARLGNLHKYIEGEQVAAGWPAWLSAVAGEAIQGWVPLKADSYEKLEKIGQGTYSSVFRARDLDTGKIVALKKVRFDNFDPESVRFMAREIQILRRLDHPNVVKLEGLITSRFSCSMYLVFEYMEHDLAGLSSCPDINFTEPQIKCYMLQLLSGLEHCHSRGIMHRDIKGSNLLVNNEGILKIADFGLANFFNPGQRQPLTSRVVTLWYRPPELLLGSTDYGAAVDLWSVGCVFAELLHRKPILQGRTEVEQLHKIFKLCGSPPDDYWKKARLPHATIFRPQQPYENCLRETCNGFSETALSLIETFLSVEPYKRGSASTALSSDYFKTKPYACDPSTLPKYPPNKEIDAKSREDARRKRAAGRTRGYEATRRTTRTSKASQEPNGICRLPASVLDPDVNVTVKEVDGAKLSVPTAGGNSRACVDAQNVAINSRDGSNHGKNASLGDEMQKLEMNAREETNHMKNASQGDIPFSGPLHVRASSGFAWAKKRRDENSSLRLHSRSSSRSLLSGVLDPSSNLQGRNPTDSKRQPNGDVLQNCRVDSYDSARRSMLKKWSQLERPDSFDASEDYHSQELSAALYQREEMSSRQSIPGSQDQGDRVEFSGPLLCQSNKVDELLEKHERHIRQAVRRSWFQRGKKHGK